ncbi:MAG: hypothetical protein KDD40_02980 [Bdellovibrionales bacterium]|nr:hypothetical protein [Bdellovibrionales bacterium]
MKSWKNRAQISQDVVRFTYIHSRRQELAQEVYVWDLDKTYLDTKFESLKGLWKTITEKPGQKKNVPGTAALVRALQDAWQLRYEEEDFPIFFITASPPQMEMSIIEKLNLDGIQPMGLYCKDNLKNLHPKRLWRLSKQVGYKLQALLEMRLKLLADVKQVMWGDDSEADAIIYNIYSDICSRRLAKVQLEKVLKHYLVTGEQLRVIFELQERIPEQDPVEKIYINLAEDTDAEYYLKFGRRVLPSFNSFQTALDLFQDKRIMLDHLIAVADDLITNFDFTRDQLERSLDDLVRRQVLAASTVHQIISSLVEHELIHKGWQPSISPKEVDDIEDGRVIGLEGAFEPWVPEQIDYFHNYR